MKKGDAVVLIMKKMLFAGENLDEKKYACKVFQYDTKREVIFLELENDDLPAISLDAIYECNIKEDNHLTVCTGRIGERYHNQHGKIIKLEINNGFYKINLKSVDK